MKLWMWPARKQTGFLNLRSLTEALTASFDTASGEGTGAAGPGATPSQLHPSTMIDPGCPLWCEILGLLQGDWKKKDEENETKKKT